MSTPRPMTIVAVTFAITVLVFAGLQAWRWSDDRRIAYVWCQLEGRARTAPAVFQPAMVDSLPEPARRFFLYTIKPGAPLRTVVEIWTSGEIGLGTSKEPKYMPMHARQILAPPHGLVWKVQAGRSAVRISGSEGFDGKRSWGRFWLLGSIPVVRAGGGPDHARAAFGRLVAESVFWAPAALLPHNEVTWEAVGVDTARASLSYKGLTQTVDITVDEAGRPTRVVIPRWSNANPEKTYRIQPFGGYLSAFREFDGYTLPTRIEGGNFIGTEDYFPFYKARVENVRFTDTADREAAVSARIGLRR